ncbi:MAG TPA: IclR family transcriptional regulator [Dermatophilaceae bacterium]|jgi:DNA-binding IclR family transcriptional regulator
MSTKAAPTPANGDSDLGPLPASLKSLLVLESVVTNERLSDIADSTQLSYSTVHRILADLTSAGWVYQTDNRRYRAGRRLLALSGLLLEDSGVVWRARPHLTRLREKTGFTVHFGLIKNADIMYAAKLDGGGSYRMKSRVGVVVPLYSTAIGKAVLATLPEAEVVSLLARADIRKVTPRTVTSLPVLQRELAISRKRGWAVDDGENEIDLRCLGAAVFDSSGRAIGGVSVSALGFEFPKRRVRSVSQDVVAAARGITVDLGGSLPT